MCANTFAARWSVHFSDKEGAGGSSPPGSTNSPWSNGLGHNATNVEGAGSTPAGEANGFEDKWHSCLIVNQEVVGSIPIRAANATVAQ